MASLVSEDGVEISDENSQSPSLTSSASVERIDTTSPHQPFSRERNRLTRKRKAERRVHETPPTSNSPSIRSVGTDKETERGEDDVVPGPVVPRVLLNSLFDLQRSEFIDSLETLRLEDSVFAYIPSRIGTSRVVDNAAHAVVTAQNYRRIPSYERSEQVVRAAAASYFSAVRVLKESLDGSDASLMACLLLQLSDSLSPDRQRGGATTHVDGISAVLNAKAKRFVSQPPSNFASMAFYSLRHVTFFRPVAQGVPSPFDDGRTALLKWTGPRRSPTWQEVSLRQIVLKLSVRLPRLIACTRSLRNDDNEDAKLEKTLQLAADLCELHDPDAETWFVRRKATYVRTLAVYDDCIGPYSFTFPSLLDWECMVVYWEAQLLLFRLCHELSKIAPADHPTVGKFTNLAHQDRMAQSILMSWQFVHERCNKGLGVRIKSALMACYSVVHVNDTWKAGPIEALRQWIQEVVDSDGCTYPDVGDIGDSLAGGPVEPFRDWAFHSSGILGHRSSKS